MPEGGFLSFLADLEHVGKHRVALFHGLTQFGVELNNEGTPLAELHRQRLNFGLHLAHVVHVLLSNHQTKQTAGINRDVC